MGADASASGAGRAPKGRLSSQQDNASLLVLRAQDSGDAIEACMAFAAQHHADADALIVLIVADAPAGLAGLAAHTARAALWSFTQHAALEWASRGLRVNMLALGASPAVPFMPQPVTEPATEEHIDRVILAMRRLTSMTGQLIRLGAPAWPLEHEH